MKQDSSTLSWNGLGDEWAAFAPNNDYRMHFIMPYTLRWMGKVAGKRILDLGCGEGGYSRELTKLGAEVTGLDCSKASIQAAISKADNQDLNIHHGVCNSSQLEGIADQTFDIVLCSMLLMDCQDFEGTVAEIVRVLRPGGRLYISILHPCFYGQHTGWQQDEEGNSCFIADHYYDTSPWEGKIGEEFHKTVVFRRHTLQDYFQTLLRHSLRLVDFNEPVPDDEQIELSHRLQRLTRVPMFAFMQWCK